MFYPQAAVVALAPSLSLARVRVFTFWYYDCLHHHPRRCPRFHLLYYVLYDCVRMLKLASKSFAHALAPTFVWVCSPERLPRISTHRWSYSHKNGVRKLSRIYLTKLYIQLRRFVSQASASPDVVWRLIAFEA